MAERLPAFPLLLLPRRRRGAHMVMPILGCVNLMAALIGAALCAAPLHGQMLDTIVPEMRSVDGHVYRGTRARPVPVADAWVVMHRIAPDSSGPLDSVRSSRTGSFGLRYRAFGSDQALYLVTTRYDGIAYYIKIPSAVQHLTGDDANLIVYDTISGPFPIRVAARHLLVFAPGSSGTRSLGEIFELSNDSTLTLIGSEASPAWRTHLPSGAETFQPNAVGDIPPDAIIDKAGELSIVDNLSPGMRQLAFTYTLGPKAFPLSLPMEEAAGVVEVLVQEPAATVTGGGLREVAPIMDSSNRIFRRFLAQDVPANAVIRVTVPAFVGRGYVRVIIGVVIVGALAMIVAVFVAVRRRGRHRGQVLPPARAPSSTEVLVRELAALDATFERADEPTDEARARYTSRRAELKAQLQSELTALAGAEPAK